MAQAINDLITSAKPKNTDLELSTQFAPIPSSERIQLLDVLRGFALFGVLVANIFWSFNGFSFVSPQRALELTAAPIDAAAYYFIRFFIDKKFILLFSLLFGFGFAVQVMRGAVVAQVEAHHFVVRGEQALRQGQQIGGVGAALPAMQQHRESLAGFASAFFRAGMGGARMEGLQRDAVTAIEQQFLAGGAHRERAALDTRPPPRPVGQDGLEMLAAEPARGSERIIER